MKIAVAADIHLHAYSQFASPDKGSLTTRATHGLLTLEKALIKAVEEGCSKFIVAGDLFNVSCPPPQLIHEVSCIFETFSPLIQISGITGNHDIETYSVNDHACAPLKGCTFFDRPTFHEGILYCPFVNDSPNIWIEEVAISVTDANRPTRDYRPVYAVIIHAGLSTDNTPTALSTLSGGVKGTLLNKVQKKLNIKHAFLGDWHNPDCYEKDGYAANQVGCLIPSSFSDAYEGVGDICILDTDSNIVTRHNIPGPRFINVDGTLELNESWVNTAEMGLYLKISCHVEEFDSLSQKLLEKVTSIIGGRLSRGCIHIVPKYITEPAMKKSKLACAAVKGAASLEEAVKLWMSGRSISEDLQQKTANKVNTFIRAAKNG